MLNPTQNDLPEQTREAVVSILNAHLADTIDLAYQIKQAHWVIKGPNFIALHELFDEVFKAVEGYADLIAERCVQLGGQAQGTIELASRFSSLPSYPWEESDETIHLQALTNTLGVYGRNVRQASTLCDAFGDADSMDVFTEISRGADKFLWMVESHLQMSQIEEKLPTVGS